MSASTRAELRRAGLPVPRREGDASLDVIRRALLDPFWHDASDLDLARAIGVSSPLVRRARREIERELRLGELLTRAHVARERLGLDGDLHDILVAGIEALERAAQRHGEASAPRVATLGRPRPETRQDGADPRARARHLLATSRALRSLRAARCALNTEGASRQARDDSGREAGGLLTRRATGHTGDAPVV